jgi:RNA recognition motif-containing protein
MEGLGVLSIPNTINQGLKLLLKNSFLHAEDVFLADHASHRAQARSRSSPPRLTSYTALDTTVMIRNIPTKFAQNSLLEALSDRFDVSCIDFFYAPTDFKSEKSLGYAFINFSTHEELNMFMKVFRDVRLSPQSTKILSLSLAKIQGREKNYNLFKTSSVMTFAPPHFRPMMKCIGCAKLSPLQSDGSVICEMC